MSEVKASYVADFSVKPEFMILSLINSANNLSLTEATVKFRGPVAISSPIEETVSHNGQDIQLTRNTTLDLDVLTDEVAEDYVTFKYARVDLAKLFSLCNPSFLETSVPVGDDGLPVEMPAFIAELKRKFLIQLTEKDFTFTSVDATHIKIAANAENLAYIGEFDISFTPVLTKRAATIELDGFSAPASV